MPLCATFGNDSTNHHPTTCHLLIPSSVGLTAVWDLASVHFALPSPFSPTPATCQPSPVCLTLSASSVPICLFSSLASSPLPTISFFSFSLWNLDTCHLPALPTTAYFPPLPYPSTHHLFPLPCMQWVVTFCLGDGWGDGTGDCCSVPAITSPTFPICLLHSCLPTCMGTDRNLPTYHDALALALELAGAGLRTGRSTPFATHTCSCALCLRADIWLCFALYLCHFAFVRTRAFYARRTVPLFSTQRRFLYRWNGSTKVCIIL